MEVVEGSIWIRVNGEKKQNTIFGEDTLTEVIVKVKHAGGKTTSRAKYSEKHNRIVEFKGNDPLKYTCMLQKIEK